MVKVERSNDILSHSIIFKISIDDVAFAEAYMNLSGEEKDFIEKSSSYPLSLSDSIAAIAVLVKLVEVNKFRLDVNRTMMGIFDET